MASASVLLHLPPDHGSAGSPLPADIDVVQVASHGALVKRLSERAWRAIALGVEDDGDLAIVSRISESAPASVVVVLRPSPTMRQVLEAEAAGAAFLLSWPDERSRLAELLAPYLAEHGDHPVPEATVDDGELVGSSPALREAYRTVARVAPSTSSVLVEGESGTGKELVARALHDMSDRRDRAFVAVNCAALPEGLLEAELFGYERGAFTGAVGRSDGRFGRADGGTLFLDEVGEMGPGLQAKLLRALESGEIERLGTGETIRVDTRVVAATNRDLNSRAREGEFREDLLYRLAVVRVSLPPLRERMEDLLPLTEAFVARFARQHGRPVRAISSEALAALRARAWPGNIRELRNVLDRAVLLARGGVVRTIDLADDASAPGLSPVGGSGTTGYPPDLALRDVEERHIRKVLAHTGGHLGDAAAILGVHRNTMTAKVRDYGIDPEAPLATPKP